MNFQNRSVTINSSPLLLKYLKAYELNPRSRVFAPLAEMYRKLGMLEEAFEITTRGIKDHPHYILGYTVLASCYRDQKKPMLAYNALRPFISGHHDNLSVQRLFAEVCFELKKYSEALDTYKYLLFLNPKDSEIIKQVKRLEDQLIPASENDESVQSPLFKQVENKHFEINALVPQEKMKREILEMADDITKEEDNWLQVTFAKEMGLKDDHLEFNDLSWEVKGHIPEFNQLSKVEIFTAVQEEKKRSPSDGKKSVVEDKDLVSLTLVDLYCAQGHQKKALNLIEKILEINPNDAKALAKKNEIEKGLRLNTSKIPKVEVLVQKESQASASHNLALHEAFPKFDFQKDISEEEKGRLALMKSFDRARPKSESDITPKIATLYGHFLQNIRHRSNEMVIIGKA